MKQIIFICALFICIAVNAQTISGYRYWYDNDINTGANVNGSYGADAVINANLPTASITAGFHTVNFMAKQSNGKWSVPVSSNFFNVKGNGIEEYEYWFDNNFVAKIAVQHTSTENLILSNELLNTSALKNGFHQINIRFKPNGGLWSAIQREMFFKKGNDIIASSSIKKIKYWFDNDWQHAQQINRAAILTDDIIGNVDCENLILGRHKICYQFMDNGNIWSVINCDSFTRAPILYKEFIYPTITLENGNTFTTGQTVIYNGEQFYPNGEVTYIITKEDDPNFLLTNELIGNGSSVGADINGKIHFTWSTTSTLKTGYYKIIAKDVTTNTTTTASNFYVKNPTDIPLNQFIQITSPIAGNIFELNKEVTINWFDRLFLNPNYNTTANILGNTALRIAKYKLEYNIDGGSWITCPTNNGIFTKNGFVDQTFSGQYGFEPTQTGTYKIKVTDLINATNIGESTAFLVVVPASANLNIDFVWDYSGNRPGTYSSVTNIPQQPKGVAADGVSRFYLKLSKKATNPKTILSATVTISDGVSSYIRLLGKVAAANNISNYSTEANSANSLSINSSNVVDGALWFWYVAPDDFARSAADNLIAEREVKAKFNVIYTDNTTELFDDIKIKIIRPPLMMVHGLNSDMTAWDNLSYHITPTTFYKFKVSKFLFKGGVQLNNMYPDGSFKLNAGALLNYDTRNKELNNPKPYNELPQENSFQNVLFKARNDGYAVNRVDYVCHSMGGCMARTAINILGSEYKPVAVSNRVFYNYDSGFINKLITINTPHNGSPIADEINEWCGKNDTKYRTILSGVALASPTQSFVDFKPSTDDIPLYTFTATNAIKDLQYNNGGIKFTQTNVKNHLIVGKAVESGSCTATLYDDIPLWIKEIIGGKGKLLALSSSYLACSILENIGNAHNVSNFHSESDLIVPLNSELAGKTISDISVSPFYGFQYNHLQVTNQTVVGDKVLELLNTSIHSAVFANNIPANTTAGNAGAVYRGANANNYLATDSVIEHINKDKIKITYPSTDATYFIDSILSLSIKILDTNNLRKVEILFQNDFVTTYSKQDSQIYKFQVRPYLNSKEYLLARASYDSLGYVVSCIDTVKLNVKSKSIPTELKLFPQITYLNPGQNYFPLLKVKYNNVFAILNKMTDSIEVIIKDTNVVRLATINKNLIAKDTGSTYIIYKYRNLMDTMFVYIYTNVSSGTVLPITLISFTLSNKECNMATLNWQTNQEINNKGFDIEESLNGIDFYKIGFVASKLNTGINLNYEYNTQILSNSKIYFRLKQIDNDGKYKYSNILKSEIKCNNNILTITPNPANKFITIQGLQNNSKHSFEIYDGKGALIKSIKENYSNTIDIEELATGMYYLKVDGGVSLKFVKE